jgi:hypothetical protein
LGLVIRLKYSQTQTGGLTVNKWMLLTPNRVLVVLLAFECFLLLPEPFQWLGLGEDPSLAALVAVAALGLTTALMFFWFLAARLLRGRFQLGLGSVVLLVMASAVTCGLLVTEMRWERSQRQAARAIEEAGGFAGYGASWLGRLLRDGSLAYLANVDLQKARDPDAALAHVHGSTRLITLWLGHAKVTDAGLTHLRGLRRLDSLDLSGTRITDAGLVHLDGLTKLRRLYLKETKVSDAGLAHLKGFRNLTFLSLSATRITDSGLVHLEGMKHLDTLFLGDTQVTDSGLVHLRGMDRLRELVLRGTRVSYAGAAELRALLPNCQIWGGGPSPCELPKFEPAPLPGS